MDGAHAGGANGPMVIVGAGLAGATAAATLREEGFTGPIALIGSEGEPPYLRPPLSKGFLAGKESAESLLPYPRHWYGENDVELVTSDAAIALEPGSRTVRLASGRSLPYVQLLLATGAAPRRLDIPGAGLRGVYYFRTKSDSESLNQELVDGGRRLVLIGSGWIGMEVAATARELGNEVTLLGLEEVPFSAAIGPELGRVFVDRHREAGVEFRLPASARKIHGNDAGRVTAIETDTGEILPADLVVIAIGVVPQIQLAEAAGLAISNGIQVDAALRTSVPGIFAAGDVANAMHPVTQQYARSEHWANALAGGKVAAKSMLGQDALLDDIPYFYTDQFDLGMEYSGFGALAKGAEIVVRGSLEEREFVSFWLRDDRVVAGMNVNVWDVQEAIQDLIRSGRSVDRTLLADPDRELGTL